MAKYRLAEAYLCESYDPFLAVETWACHCPSPSITVSEEKKSPLVNSYHDFVTKPVPGSETPNVSLSTKLPVKEMERLEVLQNVSFYGLIR